VVWPADAETTGTPYALPYPGENDIADVPKTLKALAEAIETALDKKLERATFTKGGAGGGSQEGTDITYQRRIKVQTKSPIEQAPTGPLYEGDVVFVVP
jgi:hypothetical protein